MPVCMCGEGKADTKVNFIFRQPASVVLFGLLSAAMAVCQQIPAGTILPIMSSTTVDSAKSKAGDKITGKLMQDVVLPSGEVIRAGSRIEGQVVESSGSIA